MSTYLKVKPSLSMQFDPAPWNDPAVIEHRNCVAYALNAPRAGWVWGNTAVVEPNKSPEESFARVESLQLKFQDRIIKAEHSLTPVEVEMVLYRVQGFKGVSQSQIDPAHHHVIGVDVASEHVYRLDGDGTWSHKNGAAPATDIDNSKKKITDLDSADLGGMRAVDYFRRCKIEQLMEEKKEIVNGIQKIFRDARASGQPHNQNFYDIEFWKKAARDKRADINGLVNATPVPQRYVRVPEQGLWIKLAA